MVKVSSILDKIVAQKRKRLDLAKLKVPMSDAKRQAYLARPPRDFTGSLIRHGPVALIAEIKRRSPSKGLLAPGLDPGCLAGSYQAGGAAAVSVITEKDFFSGCTQDLVTAKNATSLPVLRKDFIFDAYQIYESRAMGADALLLITRCLDGSALSDLLSIVHRLGMSAVVEVHTCRETETALRAGARVIGINNRDLGAFVTDISVTERLMPLIPRDRLVVSESGIRTRADLERVRRAGAQAVLVGEALVRRSLETGGARKAIVELLEDNGESGQR